MTTQLRRGAFRLGSRAARKAAVLATALLLAAGVAAVGPGDTRPLARSSEPRPQRVLILVVDQFRPEYVEKFDMANARALMREGTDFPRAYLGHMASETVVSHQVITSGQFPRDMGWADEVYRDTGNLLGEGKDTLHITSGLARTQLDTLMDTTGAPKLGDYLHRAFPGTKVITVGAKTYATHVSGGSGTDIQVTFSGRDFACGKSGARSWRGPAGKAVPAYLTAPACGRFHVDSDQALDYGTRTTAPAWMYPLDGNHYVPGRDRAHLGGDTWVADAGMAMMEREDWSGMLLTFPGVDKAGHMWGGITDDAVHPPGSDAEMAHLRYLAKNVDNQIGRVLNRLRALGQDKETLVVLTTDHGGMPATRFHGVDRAGRGDYNWFYGRSAQGDYLDAAPALTPLVDTGNVAGSYQDSAVRTWLKDTSRPALRRAATAMAALPDVIATYTLDGDRYRLAGSAPERMSRGERSWWRQHGQELVNTMAAPYGPDVVGLLKDDTSYGAAGDHGGAQRAAQRVPLAFWTADRPGVAPGTALRAVDILPTVLGALGITPAERDGLDGRAHPLGRE
ncbi:alkaline phosphatase family protein [Streptomyces inusitatus]|uniref:alkaline phosphatase family protein n=1 Tax=Streptomyces inusitatus TaxID=68221 RepID=UPI00167CCD31|nr:alkaline phosphatase family protein [Streptomyces inusitatus]